MSAGEIVGLALTAALIGVSAGVPIGTALVRRQAAEARRMERLAEACAAWLAARWAMSRASLSFVAAFRALAAERRESVNFSLREQEAQRARAAWCAALCELDGAEAEIMVLEAQFGSAARARWPVPQADELRGVIQGEPNQVDALRQRLRNDDERAAEFVRQKVAIHARRSRLRVGLQAVSAFASRLARQWERG